MRRAIGWLLLIGLAACSATTRQPVATAPHETQSAPSAAESQASPSPSAPSGTVAVVPIPNAQEPLPGVVTGGVPSDDNLRAAEALGYRTVVSLLPDAGDESERVTRLGMRFVSIPIAGPADLTEDNARRLAEVLNAPDQRPLILHCGSGNRAGALLALEAFYVEHTNAQAAIDLGEKAGMTSLRPVVEQRLGKAPPPPRPVDAP